MLNLERGRAASSPRAWRDSSCRTPTAAAPATATTARYADDPHWRDLRAVPRVLPRRHRPRRRRQPPDRLDGARRAVSSRTSRGDAGDGHRRLRTGAAPRDEPPMSDSSRWTTARSGSRPTASAASPPAPSSGSARAATTRCCCRDDAADRPHGAGQRLRRVVETTRRAAGSLLAAALRPGRHRARTAPTSSGFRAEPWPRWTLRFADGTRVEQEIFVPHGRPLPSCCAGDARPATAAARTLARAPVPLRARLPRAPSREPARFRFDARSGRTSVIICSPTPACRRSRALRTATYRHEPDWYRSFLYDEERARGLDCVEDLASPGRVRVRPRRAARRCWCSPRAVRCAVRRRRRRRASPRLRTSERTRRARFRSRLRARRPTPISCAAAAGRTIIAGYPWFTDWGRDTFIALRGLCLATGRLAEARAHPARVGGRGLRGHAAEPVSRPRRRAGVQLGRRLAVVRGRGRTSYLRAARRAARAARPTTGSCLGDAVEAILAGYAARHPLRHPRRRRRPARARASRACSSPGWTRRSATGWSRRASASRWRSRRCGSTRSASAAAVRPDVAELLDARHGARSPRASGTRDAGCLYDVVDVDHAPGDVDAIVPAEPDLRGRRAAVRRCCDGERGARGGRRGRARALDAARAALAGARRARLPAALRGRRARARRRLPSGHGVALAARAVRRGLGARPRRHRRRASARRARGSSTPLLRPPRPGGLGHVSRDRRRRRRRTRRAAVRSRPGRWARCCVSISTVRAGPASRHDTEDRSGRSERGSGPNTPSRRRCSGLHDLGLRVRGATRNTRVAGASALPRSRPAPVLMGLAMGHRGRADLFALGQAVRRPHEPRHHLDVRAARQGGAATTPCVRRRPVRRRRRGVAARRTALRLPSGRSGPRTTRRRFPDPPA